MAHPYWPLFDVQVRTPRITMRYLDDQLAVELAALAAKGIHEPDQMPFAYPWTDTSSPDLERDALRFYWRSRAESAPGSWHLIFAVLEGNAVVGTTSLIATDFPVTRSFETGSWVGRSFQGLGLGTELRIATLQLGFLGLHAEQATTRAYTDNAASLAVTGKLGYEPNGTERRARRDIAAETFGFRMHRSWFVEHVRRDDVEIVGAADACGLLAITPI
jgi:RimJ/RimL family protein N-acetyltransferase